MHWMKKNLWKDCKHEFNSNTVSIGLTLIQVICFSLNFTGIWHLSKIEKFAVILFLARKKRILVCGSLNKMMFELTQRLSSMIGNKSMKGLASKQTMVWCQY